MRGFAKRRVPDLRDMTQEQHETALQTLLNLPGARRYDISIRTSGDVVIHVYDNYGECLWHSKIDPTGHYA